MGATNDNDIITTTTTNTHDNDNTHSSTTTNNKILFLQTYTRPIIVLFLALLIYTLPTLRYRFDMLYRSILYLLLCGDKKWKKPKDPMLSFNKSGSGSSGSADRSVVVGDSVGGAGAGAVEKKTIVFIRHGESTWNDTFNKGPHRSALVFALMFVPGLVKSLVYEIWLLLTGKMDSWFYDSPLSYLGLDQVNELGKFLSTPPTITNNNNNNNNEETKLISILRSDIGYPESKILCSNLRRAISTVACAFHERFERHPKHKIVILPSLQEISRNPDTLSITPPRHNITASWVDRSSTLCDFQSIFDNNIDVSLHGGNKPLRTNGLERMMEFCDYVFSDSVHEEYVIAGGHSIWFRSFFRTFLPYSVDHVSKKKKVVNAGCVAFTLCRTTVGGERGEEGTYMIDPKSITVVYGGFK